MGYRGKTAERARARALRAEGLTMPEIALRLGVARSSVSLWVRDVPFEASPGRTGPRRRGPNALQRRKQAEIEELMVAGRERIGALSEREFLTAGLALYAGEGSKTENSVKFTNTDPRLVAYFCAWFRRFFAVDESRLRVRLYLHEDLDLEKAIEFWADVTGIPAHQFTAPYRAVNDPSRREAKHIFGCVAVVYSCSRTLRAILGLMAALLEQERWPAAEDGDRPW